MPRLGASVRWTQYRLSTLFVLVAIVSVPLAVWVSREREYRKRLAAVDVLYHESANMNVLIRGANPRDVSSSGSRRFDSASDTLERNDVVVSMHCGLRPLSDKKLAALVCFPTLRRLDISQSEVTSAQLSQIAKLPLVEGLDLHDTPLSDDGVRHLAAMRLVRVLNLSNTGISGDALRHLSSLRTLEELHLPRNDIDGESLRHLSGLRSLRVLDLSFTRVSDAGLAHLSSMNQLEELYLNHDDVGDDALAHLARLPKLAFVGLAASRLRKSDLSAFGPAGARRFINIGDEAISSYAHILSAHMGKSNDFIFADLRGVKMTRDGITPHAVRETRDRLNGFPKAVREEIIGKAEEELRRLLAAGAESKNEETKMPATDST